MASELPQVMIDDIKAYGFTPTDEWPLRDEYTMAFSSPKLMLLVDDGGEVFPFNVERAESEDYTTLAAQLVIFFEPGDGRYNDGKDSFNSVMYLNDDGDDFRSFNSKWPDRYDNHGEAALGAYQLLYKLISDGYTW